MRRATGVLWLSIVGLLAVLLLVWAHPVGRDSSVLNRGWNGLSLASTELGASVLVDYDDLGEVPQPATLVLIPRLPLDDSDLSGLEAFVRSGGTLVVLDDFGFGNDVLSHLAVDVRFHGGTLMDPLYCHRHASMPRVAFTRSDPAQQPGVMVLNHATWLEVGAGVDVWALSSYFSYGDVDSDGSRSGGDPDGPLPVGATVTRGTGRVVAVSDASLLLNGIVVLGDNVDAVARYARAEVLFDQVHLPEAEMDRSKNVLDAVRGVLGGGGGTVVLVLVTCCLAVGYAWYNRGRRENE
jgi:hypothetical protein